MKKKAGATRKDVLTFVDEQYGVEPEFPFADDDYTAVFRHPASEKWFGIMMGVRSEKVGLPAGKTVDVLNVKLPPDLVGFPLAEEGILPAYHMNKRTWISILLDGRVDEDKVFFFLESSYLTVTPKRKK